MITRLGVENRNINSTRTLPRNKQEQSSPSFKGGGILNAMILGIQACEKNPMINVAVIDLFSAILPRTFVESLTNWFAGFEAFRRESSGLIVNCLIPGGIAWLSALGINNFIMPKKTNMANCWADHSLLDRASEIYKATKSDDKVKESLKEIIKNIEGTHGSKTVNFGTELSPEIIETYAKKLDALSKSDKKGREITKEVEKIAKEIADTTHVYENVKLKGKKEVSANTVSTLLDDSVKYFKEYRKVAKDVNIDEFAKASKKLVKGKSALGLAIVLPLAASMQYINRWITKKTSGIDGAPIYEDFGNEKNKELRKKSQEGLFTQKLISIASMIGVSLLSMMKAPSWKMLEFRGAYPTMDQARIISTTTFASRMAVADDKNELAEATVRDIATFAGLYFLGDYAGKGAATIIENKTGIKLLNDTKPIEKNANPFKKFWHWIKDVNIKSSEEVVSKLAEDLKAAGKTPNAEQKATITKEIQKARNLRTACQVANLGVSLVLLGLIIPIFTRRQTKKNHAEAIRLAQEQEAGLKLDDENKIKK